eukprot:SAG11_NODE_913_length_6579_cov_3.562963_6_plen_218_part_00
MPFSQRTRAQQLDGIGLGRKGQELRHLEHYPKEQRNDPAQVAALCAALQPNPADFAPLPLPGEWDWLADRNTADQPFLKFVQNCGKRRPKPKSQIYLLPVAQDPANLSAFPSLPALQSMVAAFFCMPVVVLEATSLAGLSRTGKAVASRTEEEMGRSWRQYHAGDILRLLKAAKKQQHDAHTMPTRCAHTLCALESNTMPTRCAPLPCPHAVRLYHA